MSTINGTASEKTIYLGAFAHCTSQQEVEICEAGAIGVDSDGKIAFIERDIGDIPAYELRERQQGWEKAKIVEIKDQGFFFPGFIDTHIHASQYPNSGIFGKSTLLDWLNTYTFPLESSFTDLAKAQRIYARVVNRTLSHGTTTACYYATVHVEATNLLSDICLSKGQRAFVGRVCMDQLSPDYYRDESTETAIQATEACIAHVGKIDPKHHLITPIITPRFAPSCSEGCLNALGKLAQQTGLPIQTHISENKSEIELVAEMFPSSKSYTDVYDKAGLLNAKTILAHAVHLSPEERALIRSRDAKISHCPASNTALTSGAAPVRTLLDEGLTVGLGTDVSGGYSPSILEEARQAILVSRHVAMVDGDAAKLSTEEALWLATRGGAKVVGLESRVGGFEVGMDWDAQMISLDVVSEDGEMDGAENKGPVDVFMWESWSDRLNKWFYGGDDRNTAAVWVKGRLVHTTPKYRG
ncbi:guanine deaminase [Aureobasidium pullulans]|uniref:Guanine deaminase n=1 Tax=Aureobasidium pullulans TaxID=5580 RepID=A0A4S9BT29_AURPU|nr:guanine deaminase [Aureobasidium pullulans]